MNTDSPIRDADALVDLAIAWDEPEAAMLASALEAEGIESIVVGGGVGDWSEAPGISRPRVQVRAGRHADAVTVLSDLSERIDAAREERREAPQRCPVCRYDLIGITRDDVCPECGLELRQTRMRFRIVPLGSGSGPARVILIAVGVLLAALAAAVIASSF